jgi:hypothetical protein
MVGLWVERHNCGTITKRDLESARGELQCGLYGWPGRRAPQREQKRDATRRYVNLHPGQLGGGAWESGKSRRRGAAGADGLTPGRGFGAMWGFGIPRGCEGATGYSGAPETSGDPKAEKSSSSSSSSSARVPFVWAMRASSSFDHCRFQSGRPEADMEPTEAFSWLSTDLGGASGGESASTVSSCASRYAKSSSTSWGMGGDSGARVWDHCGVGWSGLSSGCLSGDPAT